MGGCLPCPFHMINILYIKLLDTPTLAQCDCLDYAILVYILEFFLGLGEENDIPNSNVPIIWEPLQRLHERWYVAN